jgi:hypothetical protein
MVLILIYSKEEVALREADRCVREGKKEVLIYKIDSRKKDRPMEYCEIQPLILKLGLTISDYV